MDIDIKSGGFGCDEAAATSFTQDKASS